MKKLFNKNIIKKALIIIGSVSILVILFFAIRQRSASDIETVKIILESKNPVKLISEEDILIFLQKATRKNIKNQDIRTINIEEIEKLLDKSKYIKNSEVFIGTNGVFTMLCVLNDPIIRVSGNQNEDFYFDADGNIIPLSKRATCRVPLLSGNLHKIDFNKMKKEGTTANIILHLGKKLSEDAFLSALIEQIYIEDNGKLILIPKIGHQKLEFGELTNVDEKLEKIRVFYKSGMAGSGWKKFNRINLEWEGQVVGSS